MRYLFAVLLALASGTGLSQDNTQLDAAIETFHEGRFSAAAEALAQHPDEALAHYYLSRLHLRDDLDTAEEHINHALDLAPDQARYHFMCGQIMANQAQNAFFSAMGYAKKSRRCFEQAVELAPDNPMYQRGLIQFYAQAPGIVGGDEDKAASMTAALAETHPGHAARLRIAGLDGDARQQALNEALGQHPDNDELRFFKGILAQQNGEHAVAIEQFESIIQRHTDTAQPPPAYHNALYQRARSALLSGEDQQRGIETMQRYLELPRVEGRQAENYWAHLRLAQLLIAEGDQERAATHLAQARKSEDEQLLAAMQEAQL